MLLRKIFAYTTYIILTSIIGSCTNIENESIKTSVNNAPSKDEVIFDREHELFEVLDFYEIPTVDTKIVLMPPTKCSNCKLGALKVLESLQNVYILTSDSAHYEPVDSTQRLVCYDSQLINEKGLVKLYSAIITLKNDKVTNYEALVN